MAVSDAQFSHRLRGDLEIRDVVLLKVAEEIIIGIRWYGISLKD